jgi:hypothetical protein
MQKPTVWKSSLKIICDAGIASVTRVGPRAASCSWILNVPILISCPGLRWPVNAKLRGVHFGAWFFARRKWTCKTGVKCSWKERATATLSLSNKWDYLLSPLLIVIRFDAFSSQTIPHYVTLHIWKSITEYNIAHRTTRWAQMTTGLLAWQRAKKPKFRKFEYCFINSISSKLRFFTQRRVFIYNAKNFTTVQRWPYLNAWEFTCSQNIRSWSTNRARPMRSQYGGPKHSRICRIRLCNNSVNLLTVNC